MSKVKGRIREKKKGISDLILLLIFIALFVLVIFLIIRLIGAKQNYGKNKVVFKLPIIEENLNAFEIDVANKKKNDVVDYSFCLTNFRDDKVNNETFKYQFFIKSETKAEYKLTEKGSNKNLLKTGDISDYIDFAGKRKEERIYILNIKLKEDQKSKSMIYLYIEGKK